MTIPETIDLLFGGFTWYRRLRGGKWEQYAVCCAYPSGVWKRVELFRARYWPTIVTREDYRR